MGKEKACRILPAGSFFVMRLYLTDFLFALAANILGLVFHKTIGSSTKNAGWLVFMKNDIRAIDIDLEAVFLFNVHCASQFDGKHNPPKFIHFSHYASRFHDYYPLQIS